MKTKLIPCLVVLLLCAARSFAQTPSPVTDIRNVDFLNFTYHSTLCSKEYGTKGIGKTVRVVKGEFKNKNIYYSVADEKVVYGDVTGDGSEDAVVLISCGATMANFNLSEVHIYTIQNGRATWLAGINDKDMERDYRTHYPDADSYWGILNGVKVANGNLEIEVLADGSHASPKYIVPLQYRLSGKTLGLGGKPERKDYTP